MMYMQDNLPYRAERWTGQTTALRIVHWRETYEEIGIPPGRHRYTRIIDVAVYTCKQFLVHPFVGFMHKEPEFEIQPNKVANLIEAPISVFIKQKNKSVSDLIVRNEKIEQVPHYISIIKISYGAPLL